MTGEIYGVGSGTPITWQDTGGTAVMTLQAMASTAGRVGARVDLGAWPRAIVYRWYLELEWAAAPTIDQTVELYFGLWDNDTGPANPQAQLPATDTPYSAGAAGLSKRKNLIYTGVVQAETAAVGPFSNSGIVRLPARYVSPLVYNGGTPALKNTSNASFLRLTPLYLQVQP